MGMSYSDFSRITPRDFLLYTEGFAKKREQDRKESIYQAYLISRWVWAKKIDIEKILNVDKKLQEKMTNEQMLAQVKMLNKLFGGEVKTSGEK